MGEIFNSDCRQSLSMMLAAKMEEEKELQRVCVCAVLMKYSLHIGSLIGDNVVGTELNVVLFSMIFIFLQATEKRAIKVQADDPISFAQLVNKAEMGATEVG
jgi:hypothetical protein